MNLTQMSRLRRAPSGDTHGIYSPGRFAALPIAASLAAILVLLSTASAMAGPITGNPSADGWAFQGNSLANGTYIRGSGNIDFDLYATSFTVGAGSPFIAKGWSIGDQVLAMGGVITTIDGVTAGWGSAFTGDPVNADLTTSARIVSKFGVSPTSWSASTVKPITGGNTTTTPGGNGLGATGSGDGGSGAVILGTALNDINPTVAPMNPQGVLLSYITGDTNAIFYGPSYAQTNIPFTANIGLYSYHADPTSNLLTSWEVFLNVNHLAANTVLPSGASLPAAGDRIDQAIQRNTNAAQFTDALGTIPTPEPATWTLAVLGGLGIGVIRWRKKLGRSRQAT